MRRISLRSILRRHPSPCPIPVLICANHSFPDQGYAGISVSLPCQCSRIPISEFRCYALALPPLPRRRRCYRSPTYLQRWEHAGVPRQWSRFRQGTWRCGESRLLRVSTHHRPTGAAKAIWGGDPGEVGCENEFQVPKLPSNLSQAIAHQCVTYANCRVARQVRFRC